MGGLLSNRSDGVDDVDHNGSSSYRYPPASGPYFADYFIMGGSKFSSTQPESYLFGENSDLNYLSPKPVPFPYPSPHGNEPTKTLCSLVNLRKDSLRLVRCTDPSDEITYHIEFLFDADVKCSVMIYYQAMEDSSSGLALYTSKEAGMSSPKFSYPKGAGQLFSNPLRHRINPKQFTEESLSYNPLKDTYIPVVIQINVEEEEYLGHSNITLATFEQLSDESYVIKPLKQKQMVDGLCYLLQEIYGIENKAVTKPSGKETDADDEVDDDDNVLECVICMSDFRDTLILPCRHLCLCKACADSLRYQSSTCPICRSPFHALLQIRAYSKKSGSPGANTTMHGTTIDTEEEIPGYQEIPLVEALNGRFAPDNIPEEAVTRMQELRRSSSARSARRASSRASSAKSQRRLERAMSAGAVRVSRPRTAQSDRAEEPREEPRLECYENAIHVASCEEIVPAPVEEIIPTTPPPSRASEQAKNSILSDEVEDDVPELTIHVDVSLPGTPLGSENSNNSGRSSRGGQSFSSAPAATPTCVNLEEDDHAATV
ncbi:E3 ubiquitin ligase RNF157 isoform X2 [Nematostella vectensis]|uniref:E3 ubiquitin ligase RNF157 isoform X2 n=1 Tax=Nematostella vectensis TaxID=45351 RepID=UPI00207700A5|nr:E3 ubiquitin ligase RNF157 isoform X2 [Nematostella vectensis]